VERIQLRLVGPAGTKERARSDPRRPGRPYTTAQTKASEGTIREAWKAAGEIRMPDDAALRLIMTVFVVRPKGHYNTKGELNKLGLGMKYPIKSKPDLDNAQKIVMDALNGVAYRDDVAFVQAVFSREWSEWAETWITIEPVV
jgi:Holliday junction resolvase RusA-like endonuclease